MYLFVNNRKAKCVRVADRGFRDEAEFYWTWQVYSINGGMNRLHQGFSTSPKIDDGTYFEKGQIVKLNDPNFLIELPELEDGEERAITVDMYCWESDPASSTIAIKKTFTNAAANNLWKIYNEQEKKKRKAIREFEDWIDSSSKSFLTDLVSTASAASGTMIVPYLELAKECIPLIKTVVAMLRANSKDDLIGNRKLRLLYAKNGNSYMYRWLLDEGLGSTYDTQKEPYYLPLRFREDTGENIVDTQWLFQVVMSPDM